MHATHAPSMILWLPWLSKLDQPYTCTYQDQKLEMTSHIPEIFGERCSSCEIRCTGHCLGLFCLEVEDRYLAIWNPALRESRKVSRMTDMFGFGYDYSIQDHKIVLITLPWEISGRPPSKAQVLTLKSNVSKTIDFPWTEKFDCSRVKCVTEGILVGENLFWQLYAVADAEEIRDNILGFNLVTETFSYCLGPVPKMGTLVYRVLIALRGSLCAVERERQKGRQYSNDMVVWCAEHEKNQIKSWSRILKLTRSDIERSMPWGVDEFRLVGVMNHVGGVLLIIVQTTGRKLKLCEYNLEVGTLRKVKASLPLKLCYYGSMQEYVPSLVPTTRAQIFCILF